MKQRTLGDARAWILPMLAQPRLRTLIVTTLLNATIGVIGDLKK